jgi:uncharacterized lipoprotein YddW (UPF0748 family)
MNGSDTPEQDDWNGKDRARLRRRTFLGASTALALGSVTGTVSAASTVWGMIRGVPEGSVAIDGNTADIYPNGYYEVRASDGSRELTVSNKNGTEIDSVTITVDGDTRYDETYDLVRGGWRRPPTDVDGGIEQMKSDLDRYHDYGVNDVFIETFYHGSTIYPSAHTVMKDGYSDTYLEELIEYAHGKGMRVHAWVETMYWWNAEYLDDPQPDAGHPLNGEDEYVTSSGETVYLDGQLLTTDQDGTWRFESGKQFVSPFNDDVVTLLENVVSEIQANYDVDGVQLDYIRFPKADPAAGYGESSPYDGTQTEDEMQTLREDAVDGAVDRVSAQIDTWTAASAAVFPAYYTSNDDAEYHKSQDWEAWGREYDLDWSVPMCYAYDSAEYDSQMQASIDRQSWGETVMPGLAINDGHDDLDTQYSYYEDYDFAGYVVWSAEDIDSPVP